MRTGQAVFPRLSPAVDVVFTYRVTSSERVDVAGTGALEAVVSDGLGWSRTVPIAAPRTFSGRGAMLTGTLRLDRLRRTIGAFERETGTKATEYSVVVTPRVRFSGRVGGTPVGERFSPSLDLRLDGARLALGTTPTGESASLESERAGSLVRDVPAETAFGGLSLPVFRLRAIGLLGCEAALGLAILLRLPILLEMRRSEAAAIRVRMGGRLVDVADLPRTAPGGCVDLDRMADLARVAERADMPIMAVERDGRAATASHGRRPLPLRDPRPRGGRRQAPGGAGDGVRRPRAGALPRALRARAARAVVAVALVAGLGGVLTAANALPPSAIGHAAQAVTPNALKPAAFGGVTLHATASGSGAFSGSGSADLVTGSGGADDITALGGDDCVLGGGGDDVIDGGPGSDVCVGGPGADTFTDCESQIQ